MAMPLSSSCPRPACWIAVPSLQPLEFSIGLHGARSLDELQQTLELADALGVFVGRKYLTNPASTEPEDRKDQQAVEDLVTVLVEE